LLLVCPFGSDLWFKFTGPRYSNAFLATLWDDMERPTRFVDWERNNIH
jgi:hypothetical protein